MADAAPNVLGDLALLEDALELLDHRLRHGHYERSKRSAGPARPATSASCDARTLLADHRVVLVVGVVGVAQLAARAELELHELVAELAAVAHAAQRSSAAAAAHLTLAEAVRTSSAGRRRPRWVAWRSGAVALVSQAFERKCRISTNRKGAKSVIFSRWHLLPPEEVQLALRVVGASSARPAAPRPLPLLQ